jgi:hypothetical protein
MAPANLLHIPYLVPFRLLPREHPDDTRAEIPNVEPETGLPATYKYPPWAIAIGALCVAITCLFFAFLCAGLNRRNNRRAALVLEYPGLEDKVPLASGLAGSTSMTAAALAMPKHAEKIGTLALPENGAVLGLGVVTMPAKLKRMWRRWDRRRVKEEEVDGVAVGVVELKTVGMSSTKMEPEEDGTR